MKFSTSLLFASVLSAGLLVGCDGGSGTSQPAQKTAAEPPRRRPSSSTPTPTKKRSRR